jgi:putative peptidoglycan lipid II flippase
MTWPMHDAGPTTPEPGAPEPGLPEPGPEPGGPEPGRPEPGRPGMGPEEPGTSRRARHAAAPDPLPPMEGPMPGGGPSPAETTLPLALSWPAPPARPPRTPRFTPAGPPGSPGPRGSVPAPADWRRVPSQPGSRPADDLRPRYPQPGSRPADLPPGQRAGPRSSLIRSSAGMALGTLVSRGTGFLRTLVLVYALGTSYLGNAYNNANTLPNTVYYLMLGGIFTSVVVPLLVKAAKRDPDHGEAYAQRLFTLGAVALGAVTVLATLAAGPLVDLYTLGSFKGPPGSEAAAAHSLMVLWAYFFIPQIFFYGMCSLIGAILNTRGRFAAPMWAPVVNNVVVIVIGGLYVWMVGLNKVPSDISSSGVQLLGIGTTLGVVAQTAALVPSLRRAGFRWHPALGFRPGEVAEMGRMAGWMSVYVITQWAGYLVVQIVANRASQGTNGYSAYSIAWQLFQLPYAIVGISVITALLPRMSEHATARRYSLVRDDFSIGVRLASVLVVPAAIYLFVLGGPMAEFLFSYGSNAPEQARYIGEVFGLFSLGLVPYMLTQLQLRVFYSFQDSRMAAVVGAGIMCVGIAGNLIALSVLPHPDVVAGLAVAYGVANLVGAIAGWALLLRRVGSLDGWHIARSLTRMHLATVPGLVFALAVMAGAGHVLHNPSAAYGLVVTVVGGGGAVLLYGLCARALRIAEFGFLAGTVAAKFGGQSRRH